MSICLFPSTAAILPRLLDDVFADLDDIEKALRSHSKNETSSSGHGDKHSGSRKRPQVVNDDTKLTISLDVKRFKPEDLKVNLEDRVLTVEGSQEVKEKDGYSLRSFVRQWNLPKDVNLDQLHSSITEDGHLSIEAPKLRKQPSRHTKNIPIHKAGQEQ